MAPPEAFRGYKDARLHVRRRMSAVWQNSRFMSASTTFSEPALGTRHVGAASQRPRAVIAWLLACCALVFAMVVVGGVTRLTHSGPSITEWQPIVGTLPPLGDAQWQDAFAKYQLTPEYREVNHDMTLEGFKRIFWWEYAHRLLGRAIGVGIPRAVSHISLRVGAFPPGYAKPLAAIFVLGGAAGRDRLVHGAERTRRRSAGIAVPAERASRHRIPHFRGDAMVCAVDRCSRERAAASRTTRVPTQPLRVRARRARIRHGARPAGWSPAFAPDSRTTRFR